MNSARLRWGLLAYWYPPCGIFYERARVYHVRQRRQPVRQRSWRGCLTARRPWQGHHWQGTRARPQQPQDRAPVLTGPSADHQWLAQCCPGPSLLWLSCSSTGLQCPVCQTWSHSYLEQKTAYWGASRHRGSYCQTLLEHRVKSVNIFSSLVSGSLNFKLKVDSTAV